METHAFCCTFMENISQNFFFLNDTIAFIVIFIAIIIYCLFIIIGGARG